MTNIKKCRFFNLNGKDILSWNNLVRKEYGGYFNVLPDKFQKENKK